MDRVVPAGFLEGAVEHRLGRGERGRLGGDLQGDRRIPVGGAVGEIVEEVLGDAQRDDVAHQVGVGLGQPRMGKDVLAHWPRARSR
mgnify:CR=1 FL=1